MIDYEKVITGLKCCTTKDEHGDSLCEECPYSEKGMCENLDVMLCDALMALGADPSDEKLTGTEEIISSLLDQARDKDNLANGDVDSIFTEDAKMLRAAADLLRVQEPRKATISNEAGDGWKEGYCPKCGLSLDSFYNSKYCGNCGQAVKWE